MTKTIESLIAKFRDAEAATTTARAAISKVVALGATKEEWLAQVLAKRAVLESEDAEARLRAQLADALDVAEADDPKVHACLVLHDEVTKMLAAEQETTVSAAAVLATDRERHIDEIARVAGEVYERRHAAGLPVSAKIAWTRGRHAGFSLTGAPPIEAWLARYPSTTEPQVHSTGEYAALEQKEIDLRASIERELRDAEKARAAYVAEPSRQWGSDGVAQRAEHEARKLADAHRGREVAR